MLKTLGLSILGALTIAGAAQVSVPMVPVPTTLQTLALFAVALAAGARVGTASATLYLGLVLAGLPVLSSAQQYGGIAFLEFAASGYVVAFIPGAALCGWLGHGQDWKRRVVASALGHALVLALGTAVLARWLGPADALEKGLLPFVIAAAVKSVAAGLLTTPPRAGEAPPEP